MLITKNKKTLRKYFSNFYLNKVYAIRIVDKEHNEAEVLGMFDNIKEARKFYK